MVLRLNVLNATLPHCLEKEIDRRLRGAFKGPEISNLQPVIPQ